MVEGVRPRPLRARRRTRDSIRVRRTLLWCRPRGRALEAAGRPWGPGGGWAAVRPWRRLGGCEALAAAGRPAAADLQKGLETLMRALGPLRVCVVCVCACASASASACACACSACECACECVCMRGRGGVCARARVRARARAGVCVRACARV